MGLLDVFGKKSGDALIKKHAPRAINKRAQAHDRWESIQVLLREASPEAIEALMERFNVRVDPSITDHEEKEAVVQGIVAIGQDAVAPVIGSMGRAESLAWPIKILSSLMPAEALTAELIAVLSTMTTDYERDPQRKLHLLGALAERKDERIAAAVLPFLEDVSENVRFSAIGALLAQDNSDEHMDALAKLCAEEESVRVRALILDAHIDKKLSLGDHAEEIKKRLPEGYTINKIGNPARR